mmetsp:Transcript_21530/g.19096  ORF Transcript_21530/g.19096 Transcript_21530/m.19096 type:complete len:163 (+) Transcript_21530:211-699(+)
MKGYLQKLQPKALLFGKWKSRYCILKQSKFKYYENNKSKVQSGVIDFNKVECFVSIHPDDEKIFKLGMKGNSKEIVLKGSNEEEAADWRIKIEDCIKKSEGKKKGLIIMDPKFWKDEYIDVKEFKNLADNGDVLLFKSETFGTKMQRVVTRSGYDHVGMIVL